MKWRLCKLLLRLVVLIYGLFTASAFADSQARIVRLSDVQGNVQIDQATGQGYERAFLNLPIQQGSKLKTGTDSRAEIELEDGSVIHLTPNTVLQFLNLSLSDSGAKLSTIEVLQGQAYFNLRGQKDNELTVSFGQERARPAPPAHFRVNMNETSASLAVFSGSVQVAGLSGEVEIGKNHTATFDLGNDGRSELVRKIDKDPSDQWDKQQIESHEQYLAKSTQTGYPYAYGLSDLSYYGSFLNLAGYGSCWSPYFTGFGWDPFMDGAWIWDPSFGYTWVSAYPWGWMPYHYGSWMYAGSGSGWCWLPGNTWVTRYVPVIRPPRKLPPRGFQPPAPPAAGGRRIVPVGRGLTSSTLLAKNVQPSTLVVNRGDAGLSIPRGVHNLKEINHDFMANHGQVTLQVSAARSGGGNVLVTRQGTAAASQTGTAGRVGMGSNTGASHIGAPAPPPAPSVQTGSQPHK